MFLVHPTITPEQMAAYAEAVRSVVTGGLVKVAREWLRLQVAHSLVRAGAACCPEGKHRMMSSADSRHIRLIARLAGALLNPQRHSCGIKEVSV